MQGKECLRKSVLGNEIIIETDEVVPGIYVVVVSSYGNNIIYRAKGIKPED
jgi:hypothetical protein